MCELVQQFTITDYILISIAVIEQVLSFTGENQPKSIFQVILALFYQTYRLIHWFCYIPVGDTNGTNGDNDNISTHTTKTVKTIYSINVGTRV